MERRFDKYKSESKVTADQIANINSFIDWCFNKGRDLIEKEIQSLEYLIDRGEDNAMFPKKINQLIALGEKIEDLYETYHFNRENRGS